MRLRSILDARPGSDLQAAVGSEADALLFTLADADHDLSSLRAWAAEGAQAASDARKHVVVVVNHPRTRLLREDIAALPLAALHAVFLPHAVEPQDVRDLAVLLREFELQSGAGPGQVAIFPMVDTARGLLRAADIVAAAPRVGGLVFDTTAYARDVGARDEAHGERLAYARGRVVAAARAHEGQPLVRGSDLEFLALSQYGFEGAVVEGIGAVALANSTFTPALAVVDRARAAVQAYDEARAEGAWVARLGTEVIDAHAARKARRLLDV